MKKLCPLLLVLLLSTGSGAREVSIRLWVSGGMEGLVMGNREHPGWLSVSTYLQKQDPEACWIQLGVNPDPDCLAQLVDVAYPDIVIPTEQDFRIQGRAALEALDQPGTLLNVSQLPQFPDYQPAFPKKQVWTQADGIEIHPFGLLSDKAPLRIPADRLRPLRVHPPLTAVRDLLAENPVSDSTFPVVALPEGADGREWSERLPEIPLLILPAQGQARIIEANGGSQLRIQPALHGRSVIRVQVYWDTVTRQFSSPKAEIVWMRAPEFQELELPACLLKRIRPLEHVKLLTLSDELLKHADSVFGHAYKESSPESRLPDAVRVSQLPRDYSWLKVIADATTLERWKHESIPVIVERPKRPSGDIEILMTADIAAGNGEWNSVIRQDLLSGRYPTEWMSFTSRDLILPVEEIRP